MMDILLGGLCLFTMLIALVTVIGHGIWVSIRMVMRAFAAPESTGSGRWCSACGSKLHREANSCPFCRRPVRNPKPLSTYDELEITESQLQRLLREGWLSEEDSIPVIQAIRQEQSRLLYGTATARRSDTEAARSTAFSGARTASAESTEADSVAADSGPGEMAKSTAPPSTNPVPVQPLEIAAFVEPEPEPEPEPSEGEAQESRTLADLLQAFMQRKNIRWAELVSGLLIVGSATGLVISLWATLRDTIPYFPALLFLLATTAIHGAGLYTLRKWQLKATSHGLLLIAMLLVPLNFLAVIALSGLRPITDPIYVVAVAVGLATFGGMVSSGARILMLRGWGLLWIAIMGTSASQLIIRRQVEPNLSAGMVTLYAGLPIVSYLVAAVGQTVIAMRWKHLTARRTSQIFLLLGLSLFALLVPLSLLVWKTGTISVTLGQLSPCLSLAATPILILGLVVHRRIASPRLAITRTVGTAIALVGASLMLAAVYLAWPQPEFLVAVGVINFLALTVAAVVGELPIVHAAAVASGSLAYLVAFHSLPDGIPESLLEPRRDLMSILLMGRSGIALTLLAVVVGGTSWVLQRAGWTRESRAYRHSGCGLAVLSVLIAVYAGFWSGLDQAMATPVFAVYGILSLLVSPRMRNAAFTWLASGLIWMTLVHGLVWNDVLQTAIAPWPWLVEHSGRLAFLLHATIAGLIALWAAHRGSSVEGDKGRRMPWTAFTLPFSYSAAVTSTLVFPVILLVLDENFAARAGYTLWIALVWLMLSLIHRSHVAIHLTLTMMTLAVGFGTTAICQHSKWWNAAYHNPRHLQAQFIGMAVWSIVLVGIRRLLRQWPPVSELFAARGVTIDRLVLGLSVVGLLKLSILGCMPGLRAELDAVASPSMIGFYGHLVTVVLIVFLTGILICVVTASLRKGIDDWTIMTWVLMGGEILFATVPIERPWLLDAASYQDAYGRGSWLALAAILFALLVSVREYGSPLAIFGLFLASMALPFLAAGPFETVNATASALRWWLLIYILIVAGLAWFPTPVRRIIFRTSLRHTERGIARTVGEQQALGLPQCIVLILVLTMIPAFTWGSGRMLASPYPDSFFGRIGPSVSYSGPLFALAVLLGGVAIRNQVSIVALTGGFLFNLAVSLAYALPIWANSGRVDAVHFVNFLQWNALALAAYACVWLGGRWWRQRPATQIESEAITLSRPNWALVTQMSLAATAVTVLCIWSVLAVVLLPGHLPVGTESLGSTMSYCALALAGVMSVLYSGSLRAFVPLITVMGLGLGGLAAASVAPWSHSHNWLSYHVLTTAWLVASSTATGIACLATRLTRPSPMTTDGNSKSAGERTIGQRIADALPLCIQPAIRWATILGGLVVLLALRGQWSDPYSPWWSMGVTALVAILSAALAIRGRSQPYAYITTLLAALATTMVWVDPLRGLSTPAASQFWVELIEANLITVILTGIAWLLLELYWQHHRGSAFTHTTSWLSIHHASVGVSLAVMAILSVGCLTVASTAQGTSSPVPVTISNAGGWAALSCLLMLLAGTLWDRTATQTVCGFYVWGLIAAVLLLDSRQLAPRDLIFSTGMMLAGYVLLTGVLWTQRNRLITWGQHAGMPEKKDAPARIAQWLSPVSLILVIAVVCIEFWVVLTFPDQWARLQGAMAVTLIVPGAAVLAQGKMRWEWQLLTFMLTTVAAVDLGWALMPAISEPSYWLQRSIRLLVVLAIMAFVYGVIVVRALPKSHTWSASTRMAAVVTGAAALATLAAVLILEEIWYIPGIGAPVTTGQTIIIAVALLGLIVALISLAVLPGSDSLQLSERWRIAFVYGAEAVLALVFVHLRLAEPSLFSGRFTQHWPLIVMGIAFFGVGAGEFFQRRRFRVLAEPLHRTGVFLPLLPALGFWLLASQTNYSTVLFLIGFLYLVASFWRKSFGYSLASALTGNVGLWVLWYEQNVSMLMHPQLWLIPPALSVLAAAHVNRRQLSESQLTTIRYLAITIIYVSSTSEMFLSGVGESLWLPIILTLLSVAGVMVGMLLQIRAFLYLGSSFLLVSIVSMVWHAARNIGHVWPWWVFGIALGLTILAIFGLFEKRRKEILQLIEQLRQWE